MGSGDPFYLKDQVDFKKHNEAVRQSWSDYQERRHQRVPVTVLGSSRNLLSNPAINTTGFSFKDFLTKAEAQVRCQLAYQYYVRHNLLCDQEMGLPHAHWALR